ncbi:YceD family protein [Spelaeicoccus albus]|uniref:DUF177 domain-containing protein n=1 Tax=Spelaeicoccus albus TaxID=1280376 RepID=A0A7Z0IHI1_9MICO|nr:DUF177 domain-containing protein [Spelaeicoccus albus]NYI67729.1 uncharacterized protein [Spelaeicoccus albus]
MSVHAGSPFVFNIREYGLDRKPGASHDVRRTVPAPADLKNEVIAVPEGSDIDVSLKLESVVEGIYVSGTVTADAHGECVRCLAPYSERIEADVQELFVYDSEPVGQDEDLYQLEAERLDFSPVLRNNVVMALPLRPVCRPECENFDAVSADGVVWNAEPEDTGTGEGQGDPRWAALQDLLNEKKES